MTQTDLVALAKQGDAQAIAALMNQALQSLVTVKASSKGECLRILFESEQVPPEKELSELAFQFVLELNLESVSVIKVFGRQTGEELPAWSQELDVDKMLRDFEDLVQVPPAAPEYVPPEQPSLQPEPSDIQCPRCRSTQLVAQNKGFSYGQAAVGSVFGTRAAIAAGMAGSDEIILTCLQCNYRWELAQGHFRINPNPRPTEAKLVEVNAATRFGCGVISGGILFALGLLIAAAGGMQISFYIWTFAIIAFVGFLGMNEFSKTVTGSCPYCSNSVSVTVDDARKTCGRCSHRFTVKHTRNSYILHP